MSDDTADPNAPDPAAFDDQGNFVGETTITSPLDGANSASSGGGFDWGSLDAFINSIDAQIAGWYVLAKQPNPTGRTIPPALGGPPVIAPGVFGFASPNGAMGAVGIPPIVWIAGALVLVVLLART